jgi:hypothetical protein
MNLADIGIGEKPKNDIKNQAFMNHQKEETFKTKMLIPFRGRHDDDSILLNTENTKM